MTPKPGATATPLVTDPANARVKPEGRLHKARIRSGGDLSDEQERRIRDILGYLNEYDISLDFTNNTASVGGVSLGSLNSATDIAAIAQAAAVSASLLSQGVRQRKMGS